LTLSKRTNAYNGPQNRILIIDDDIGVRSSRHLEAKFAVDRAADASQGIGLALSGSYVIMLDVMPDLSGFDVLRDSRAFSHRLSHAHGPRRHHDRSLDLNLAPTTTFQTYDPRAGGAHSRHSPQVGSPLARRSAPGCGRYRIDHPIERYSRWKAYRIDGG
jgi:hypothetical protein